MGPALSALAALQRVIAARPPEGSLRRGLVSLPRWPAALIVLAAVALAAAPLWRAWRARRRSAGA